MNSETTVTWLKVMSALVIGFGATTAASAYPPLAGITNAFIDLAMWPIDGAQTVAEPVPRFMSAVSGGILVGWGLLFWLVSTQLYPREPELARTLILSSIGVWFVVDSVASVVAGVPLNVLLNVPFLAGFAWPLRRTQERVEV